MPLTLQKQSISTSFNRCVYEAASPSCQVTPVAIHKPLSGVHQEFLATAIRMNPGRFQGQALSMGLLATVLLTTTLDFSLFTSYEPNQGTIQPPTYLAARCWAQISNRTSEQETGSTGTWIRIQSFDVPIRRRIAYKRSCVSVKAVLYFHSQQTLET